MTGVRTLDGEQAAALLGSAAAGDEIAFTRIVAAYHPDLRRVAYVICGDRDVAEDAVQQAWQIAWRRLSTVRDPERLRSWLVAVAANEARKLASRDRRRVVLESGVREIPIATADPGSDVTNVDLARALSRLAPDDRALLALRFVAGLDSFEIARMRGRSASGVRARVGRLLERLRRELEHE
jgi:RNA polymerase sigma factor (sigma-70 family)